MTWLALLFAVELGVTPYGGWAFYDEPDGYVFMTQDRPQLYTSLEADVRLFNGHLSWRSNVTTWVRHYNGLSYAPLWSTFDTDVGVEFGAVRVGWYHMCTHPLQPYTSVVGASIPALEGGFGKLYLRYEAGQ